MNWSPEYNWNCATTVCRGFVDWPMFNLETEPSSVSQQWLHDDPFVFSLTDRRWSEILSSIFSFSELQLQQISSDPRSPLHPKPTDAILLFVSSRITYQQVASVLDFNHLCYEDVEMLSNMYFMAYKFFRTTIMHCQPNLASEGHLPLYIFAPSLDIFLGHFPRT